MRALLFSVVCGLFAGCGGNWSTTDLTFASALPRREEFKVHLPVGTTATEGEPAGSWAQTRAAATAYNGILDAVLTLVDQLRLLAPTTRTADSRTWGPFDDANNPGRQVQLVITRSDETHFEWHIDSKPSNGAFLRMFTGTYDVTDSARAGVGRIVVAVKDFRDVLAVDDTFKQLDEISLDYGTAAFPKFASMGFAFKAGGSSTLSRLGYSSFVQPDGSGLLRFSVASPGPEVTELELESRWKPTGEGRSVGLVRAGTQQAFTVTECWGTGFTLVYSAQSWPGGVTSGTEAACATVDGF